MHFVVCILEITIFECYKISFSDEVFLEARTTNFDRIGSPFLIGTYAKNLPKLSKILFMNQISSVIFSLDQQSTLSSEYLIGMLTIFTFTT